MADQTETLKVGDAAPDFSLKGTNKTDFKLSDARGKNIVLNFFPAAFSPVCSSQMTSIQAEKARLGDDTLVYGISVDNTRTVEAFKKDRGIAFELLSDFFPHGEVSQKYGLMFTNGAAHRAVIGIDKEGVVRYIDDHAVLEVPELEACALALNS